MNISEIVSQILSFADRIPERYERVSKTFQQASSISKKESKKSLDRDYPLWDLTINDIPTRFRNQDRVYQLSNDIEDIVRYHLNRAALLDDWDAFYLIATYHMNVMQQQQFRSRSNYWYNIYTAIYIAHINGMLDMARGLYDQMNKMISRYDRPYQFENIEYYYNFQGELIDDIEIIQGFIPEEAKDLVEREYDDALIKFTPLDLSLIFGQRQDNVEEPTDVEFPRDMWMYKALDILKEYPYLDDLSLMSKVFLEGDYTYEMKLFLIEELKNVRYWNRYILDAYLKLTQEFEDILPESLQFQTDEVKKTFTNKIGTEEFFNMSHKNRIATLQIVRLPVTISSIRIFD